MAGSNRTVFLVIPHGFAARYLLRTDILPTLKQAGLRIIIITPNDDERYFIDEFADHSVFIEHLEVEKSNSYMSSSRIQRFLRKIRVFVLNVSGDITTIDDLYKINKIERPSNSINRKLMNLVFDGLVWLLRRSKTLRKFLIYTESNIFVGNFHIDLFKKYQPDMVVTTSLGYFRHDEYIMREARKHRIPVVSIILSWDNTTSWGMDGAFADYVIAWTEKMKKELIELHDVIPSKIFVEGVAYFDHYYRPEVHPDRETFFTQMCLNPLRRLIILATQSPNIFPWNPDLVSMVAEAIQDGRLPGDCQLLVRLHPLHLRHREGKLVYQDLMDEYKKVQERYPFVVFNCPVPLSTRLEADMPVSEKTDLACMLKYADVMINHYSTIAIESSIFNLPTINVGFEPGDMNKMTRMKYSCMLAERRTHNQRIIRTNGVRTVRNEEELINTINLYLGNREVDYEGRKTIQENECGPNLGHAGRSIGLRLLDLLNTFGNRK